MSRSKKRNRSFESNRNARIVSKRNSRRTVRTSTQGRDDIVTVEATTKNGGSGATRLFVRNALGENIALDGYEARTLFRTLQKHYGEAGRFDGTLY